MKIIRKIFHLPDLKESKRLLSEAEKENEMLLAHIVERQKQLSEVDLNKTIDMIKELEKYVNEYKN